MERPPQAKPVNQFVNRLTTFGSSRGYPRAQIDGPLTGRDSGLADFSAFPLVVLTASPKPDCQISDWHNRGRPGPDLHQSLINLVKAYRNGDVNGYLPDCCINSNSLVSTNVEHILHATLTMLLNFTGSGYKPRDVWTYKYWFSRSDNAPGQIIYATGR